MTALKKPLYTSDYVSDRVFDGVRKLSPSQATQLRELYVKKKTKAPSKKTANKDPEKKGPA